MEIHFYESIKACPNKQNVLYDWESVKNAIESKTTTIHTTQMCMLSSTLFHDGYRVFIHQANRFVYEVTLRTKDNAGNRTVRWSQNMYAMWANNIFRE